VKVDFENNYMTDFLRKKKKAPITPTCCKFKDLMIGCHFRNYEAILPYVRLLYMFITLPFFFIFRRWSFQVGV